MAKSKCRWDCPEQWSEWSEWLASGLHARNRWRLPVLLTRMLIAEAVAQSPRGCEQQESATTTETIITSSSMPGATATQLLLN